MYTHNLLLDTVQCTAVGIGQEGSLRTNRIPPLLEKNMMHIWSAFYDDLDGHFNELSNIVSQEEQKTASTFRNSADARKYVLRHGLLRIILAHYTHCNPEMVSFKTGMNGKPELDPEAGYADISFNLSHTSEMVLIGSTRKQRIGVDVVKVEPSYRFPESAEYILTPRENAFLKSTEPALRYQIFFRIWTLKEAILKATGSTLTMMEKIDVSEIIQDVIFSPDYSMKFLDTHPAFFIWQFTCRSGHVGAIAVDARNAP